MALHFLLLVFWFLAAATETCQEKCRDVSIPYPFGIGDPKCFRNEKFRINCTGNSTTPHKAILRPADHDLEFLNISMLGHMSIRSSIGGCLGINKGEFYIHLGTDSPFTLSNTRNKFTNIGCDFLGILEGMTETNVIGSHHAFPTAKMDSMPVLLKGLALARVAASSPSLTASRLSRALPEAGIPGRTIIQDTYSLWTKCNSNSPHQIFEEPLFVTEAETCKWWSTGWWRDRHAKAETKKTGVYACHSKHSECYNSTNGHGYKCSCSKGYEGNPYLDQGCKDIDECKEKDKNTCEAIATCKNREGDYCCACPKGTHGDGKKDRKGCTKESPILEVVLGTGLSFLFLSMGSTWTFWLWRKRRIIKLKEKFFQENGGMLLRQKISSHRDQAFKIFTVEELERATDNYNINNVLGQGGFGIVYKGVLQEKRIVAIKKSKVVNRTQIEQFINEVDILSQINHRIVVKLLGCCLEVEVPFLVYEFVSNGTLSHHIRDAVDVMSLRDRLRIAEEVADALSYLHSAASMPIFHRDIKSDNILLDSNFNAKVSDFGASRLVPIDQTQITTLLQRTFGYLDPEYFQTGQLTFKSDVYSFGVVLAELLIGQKLVCFNRTEEEGHRAMYILLAVKENRLLQVLDNRILKEGREEQFTAIARIVEHCVRLKGEERPTMKEVIVELRGLRVQEHPWVIGNTEENENLLLENPDVGISDPIYQMYTF